MAREHKIATLSPFTDLRDSDELDKILGDGWEIEAWSYDPISNTFQYKLTREVPDHE